MKNKLVLVTIIQLTDKHDVNVEIIQLAFNIIVIQAIISGLLTFKNSIKPIHVIINMIIKIVYRNSTE